MNTPEHGGAVILPFRAPKRRASRSRAWLTAAALVLAVAGVLALAARPLDASAAPGWDAQLFLP